MDQNMQNNEVGTFFLHICSLLVTVAAALLVH